MRYLRQQLFYSLLFLLLVVTLPACNNEVGEKPTDALNQTSARLFLTSSATDTLTASPSSQLPTAVIDVREPTISLSELTPASPGNVTLTPTEKSIVTPTSTATPSSTTVPTKTPTPTIDRSILAATIAAADPVDRTCPAPPPARPEYLHFYLSASKWPEPDPNVEEHLWLDKPLPGGGRLLYTDWFPYGYDVNGRYLIHNGLDSAEPLGTPVLAAADGTVVVAGPDQDALYGWRCDWYGNLVVIELTDRWQNQPVYLLYGHVADIIVMPGEKVSKGQPVAAVGVGGAAILPHLHFEVRVGENTFSSTRNPLLWLKPPATRGVIAGRLVDPEGRPWQGVTVTAVGKSDGTENRTSWTYLSDPDPIINPDEGIAENFVIGDLRPGNYQLHVTLQGETYKKEVEVAGGEIIVVEMVSLPLKSPSPTPVSTAREE